MQTRPAINNRHEIGYSFISVSYQPEFGELKCRIRPKPLCFLVALSICSCLLLLTNSWSVESGFNTSSYVRTHPSSKKSTHLEEATKRNNSDLNGVVHQAPTQNEAMSSESIGPNNSSLDVISSHSPLEETKPKETKSFPPPKVDP